MKSEKQAQHEVKSSNAQRVLSSKDRPRGFYIMEDEAGNKFRIETPESYAGRKKIHGGRPSSLKKLARINRVRNMGFRQIPASQHDVLKYGPALKVPA